MFLSGIYGPPDPPIAQAFGMWRVSQASRGAGTGGQRRGAGRGYRLAELMGATPSN
jgi:hypothetical protein